MSGFKQTEIGLIPEDWEVVRFEKSILRRRIKVGKIKQQEYKKFGKYPVIDQSQNYIAGFCDDDEKVYRGELPVIIFGDHTRVFKFVNFPFVVGADGVKVLIPNKEIYDPKFLFYAMLTLNIPSRGYNRHYKLLREKKLLRPPLPEQCKIARVLDKIQQAIELQDRIIEQAKRLKKSLMQKLFTEGLYGEEQKETEIGLIPKSWEVVRLGDYLELIKNGITKKQNKEGIGLPVTRIETISEGIIDVTKVGYINSLTPKEIEKYSLKIGDILFSHINSEPHLGKSAIYTGNPPTLIHGMNLLLIRTKKERLDPFFLNNLFNWYRLRGIFIGIASRAVNQSSINQGKMKNLLIPLPSLEEQKQIAHILSVVDKKIEVEQKRKQVLKALFKTMLHKLMSGEIRLKEVEI